ncbi:MAG: glycine--tRNA ligase subunit beta, partial [Candidatus Subteraquimicrobiales bacterium]|nr:glycine--tRNA ligase subunit beta [Candidatus Subteraquimicrobiales bacterium]
YFAVEDLSEKLMAKFIFVHNGDEKFNELIKKGHERVLKARLTDAKFFFEEDLKVPFVKYVEKLKKVVHQEKLGTLFDKTIRLRDFVKVIAEKLSLENEVIKNVERAAYLCKADLVTNMVVEFPELQGIMAREYARLSSESEEIANAIFEHYLPRTSEDVLPSSIEGKVLSLADKIDEIVGCFSIGLIPTGSEDPYALRKQATGIINILLQNQFHLFLDELIEFLLSKMKVERDLLPNVKAITEEFFLGRLRAQLLGEGYSFDSIDSVLSLKLFDVLEVKNRVEVLDKLRGSEILNDIVTAFTRCKNLANLSAGAKVNCSFLMEEEEKKLFSRLIEAENKVAECLGAYDYKEALGILSGLRPIIDRFFDKVLVMTEEENIRDNRLALLNKSVSLFIK